MKNEKRAISIVNPLHLILARESRDIIQSEFAAMLGIPPTRLSKMERGELRVSIEQIGRIAERTGYPESFFYQQTGLSSQAWVWRKREKVAQRLLTATYAQVNMIRFHVQTITRALGIKMPSLPLADITETFTPEDAARALRRIWEIPEGPIPNLTSIVEAHKVPVWTFRYATDRMDSRSVLTDDLFPLITINSSHTGDRQRYSLAYQLGHLMMHIYSSISTERNTGHEANLFAAELLMPEADLRATFEGEKVTLDVLKALKKKWRVSMIALLYRADNLGYLTENQMKYLLTQFNQLELRKREPEALDVPIEHPKIIRQWLATIKRKEELDTVALAAKLHLNVDEFVSSYG